MNGPHDMGGFTSFGPVLPEANEPVFHAEWEARAFALVLAAGCTGSWPNNRPYRESLPALEYWSSSYYEIWFDALNRILSNSGLLNGAIFSNPVKGVLAAGMVPAMLKDGRQDNWRSNAGKQFAPGDKVRARNISPQGHTRLPRYVRGRVGEIIGVHGIFPLPDSQTQGLGDDPQWLYSVRFNAGELWNRNTRDSVSIDLWESYLEAF